MAQPSRKGRVVGACLGISAGIFLCGALALMVFLFTSCSFNKYIVAAGLPAPDAGFQTGTVFGYNVWIWDCHEGKRIVLYEETSEMYAGPFKREEAKCGEQTDIEVKLASEKTRPMDPRYFW